MDEKTREILQMTFADFKEQTNIIQLVKEDGPLNCLQGTYRDRRNINLNARRIFEKYKKNVHFRRSFNKKLVCYPKRFYEDSVTNLRASVKTNLKPVNTLFKNDNYISDGNQSNYSHECASSSERAQYSEPKRYSPFRLPKLPEITVPRPRGNCSQQTRNVPQPSIQSRVYSKQPPKPKIEYQQPLTLGRYTPSKPTCMESKNYVYSSPKNIARAPPQKVQPANSRLRRELDARTNLNVNENLMRDNKLENLSLSEWWENSKTDLNRCLSCKFKIQPKWLTFQQMLKFSNLRSIVLQLFSTQCTSTKITPDVVNKYCKKLYEYIIKENFFPPDLHFSPHFLMTELPKLLNQHSGTQKIDNISRLGASDLCIEQTSLVTQESQKTLDSYWTETSKTTQTVQASQSAETVQESLSNRNARKLSEEVFGTSSTQMTEKCLSTCSSKTPVNSLTSFPTESLDEQIEESFKSNTHFGYANQSTDVVTSEKEIRKATLPIFIQQKMDEFAKNIAYCRSKHIRKELESGKDCFLNSSLNEPQTENEGVFQENDKKPNEQNDMNNNPLQEGKTILEDDCALREINNNTINDEEFEEESFQAAAHSESLHSCASCINHARYPSSISMFSIPYTLSSGRSIGSSSTVPSMSSGSSSSVWIVNVEEMQAHGDEMEYLQQFTKTSVPVSQNVSISANSDCTDKLEANNKENFKPTEQPTNSSSTKSAYIGNFEKTNSSEGTQSEEDASPKNATSSNSVCIIDLEPKIESDEGMMESFESATTGAKDLIDMLENLKLNDLSISEQLKNSTSQSFGYSVSFERTHVPDNGQKDHDLNAYPTVIGISGQPQTSCSESLGCILDLEKVDEERPKNQDSSELPTDAAVFVEPEMYPNAKLDDIVNLQEERVHVDGPNSINIKAVDIIETPKSAAGLNVRSSVNLQKMQVPNHNQAIPDRSAFLKAIDIFEKPESFINAQLSTSVDLEKMLGHGDGYKNVDPSALPKALDIFVDTETFSKVNLYTTVSMKKVIVPDDSEGILDTSLPAKDINIFEESETSTVADLAGGVNLENMHTPDNAQENLDPSALPNTVEIFEQSETFPNVNLGVSVNLGKARAPDDVRINPNLNALTKNVAIFKPVKVTFADGTFGSSVNLQKMRVPNRNQRIPDTSALPKAIDIFKEPDSSVNAQLCTSVDLEKMQDHGDYCKNEDPNALPSPIDMVKDTETSPKVNLYTSASVKKVQVLDCSEEIRDTSLLPKAINIFKESESSSNAYLVNSVNLEKVRVHSDGCINLDPSPLPKAINIFEEPETIPNVKSDTSVNVADNVGVHDVFRLNLNPNVAGCVNLKKIKVPNVDLKYRGFSVHNEAINYFLKSALSRDANSDSSLDEGQAYNKEDKATVFKGFPKEIYTDFFKKPTTTQAVSINEIENNADSDCNAGYLKPQKIDNYDALKCKAACPESRVPSLFKRKYNTDCSSILNTINSNITEFAVSSNINWTSNGNNLNINKKTRMDIEVSRIPISSTLKITNNLPDLELISDSHFGKNSDSFFKDRILTQNFNICPKESETDVEDEVSYIPSPDFIQNIYKMSQAMPVYGIMTKLSINRSQLKSTIPCIVYNSDIPLLLRPVYPSTTMRVIINISSSTEYNKVEIFDNPLQLILSFAKNYKLTDIITIIRSLEHYQPNTPYGLGKSCDDDYSAKEYAVFFEIYNSLPLFSEVTINYKDTEFSSSFIKTFHKPKAHLADSINHSLLLGMIGTAN